MHKQPGIGALKNIAPKIIDLMRNVPTNITLKNIALTTVTPMSIAPMSVVQTMRERETTSLRRI